MTKKKIITSLLLLVLVVIGLIGGVYLVKQRQEIRKLAAPATTIYFEPSTKTANVEETVNFDILMDTGENALATIRLDIVYDSTFLQPLSLNFNSNLLSQILRPADLSQPGKITGSAGVAPGSFISGTSQKVASVSFRTLSVASLGTTIGFGPDTSAYSATLAEPVGSNLITQKSSATVVIAALTGPTTSPTAPPSPPEATLIPTPTSLPGSGGAAPTSTPTPTPTLSLTPTSTPTGETTSTEEELPVTGQITPIFILFLFGFTLLGFGISLI